MYFIYIQKIHVYALGQSPLTHYFTKAGYEMLNGGNNSFRVLRPQRQKEKPFLMAAATSKMAHA
ncbi:hypothetical protein [Paenibacillus cremeus]|uniref:Uncharacterized protein n=1 Tax=Paenibacillus cremeus TaxID=2163881 RepID=A0A559K4R8_9BACL|nr:hypothetical protein [Paenibacillus cremeus]TVY07132.1 hypothetical protein FPZ49_25430 [Paenibacillus cremeus]